MNQSSLSTSQAAAQPLPSGAKSSSRWNPQYLMTVIGKKFCRRRPTRRVRMWVRNVFRKWCVDEELPVSTRAGFQMNANPRNYGSYGIYFFGEYDAPMTSVLKHLVREGDTAWDVGTERGWFSCLLAHVVGETGRVDSFEALPANAALLKKNLELNHMHWVNVNEVAVSDTQGEATFHLPTPDVVKDHAFLEFFSGVGYLTEEASADTITVKTISLDDYAQETNLESLALIKLDIEGAEVKALRGAERVLRKFRPVISIEYNRGTLLRAGSSLEELDELLETLEYDRFTFRTCFRRLNLRDWDGVPDDQTVFNVYAFPRSASREMPEVN